MVLLLIYFLGLGRGVVFPWGFLWAEPAGLILGPPARSRKVTQALTFFLSFGCAGPLLPHGGFSLVAAAGLLPVCGARASHCGGSSCWGPHGPRASGAEAPRLWRTGAVFVGYRLSCSGVHVGSSKSGIKPVSPVMRSGFFPTEPPGKPRFSSCYIASVVVVIQSLSCVWFSVTPWTAAFQAFLSFT